MFYCEGLELITESNEEYFNIQKELMILEHNAIVSEDSFELMMLQEEGENKFVAFFKNVIAKLKEIFNKFKEYVKKMVATIKAKLKGKGKDKDKKESISKNTTLGQEAEKKATETKTFQPKTIDYNKSVNKGAEFMLTLIAEEEREIVGVKSVEEYSKRSSEAFAKLTRNHSNREKVNVDSAPTAITLAMQSENTIPGYEKGIKGLEARLDHILKNGKATPAEGKSESDIFAAAKILTNNSVKFLTFCMSEVQKNLKNLEGLAD